MLREIGLLKILDANLNGAVASHRADGVGAHIRAIAASNLAAVSLSKSDVYGGYAKPNPGAINSPAESKRDSLDGI